MPPYAEAKTEVGSITGIFKLPDGIIIATAIYLDLPLVSADQEFKKAEILDLIFYEK